MINREAGYPRPAENATPGDAILTTRELVVGYQRSNPVLREISFAVKPGQFWFLLGPNGAGKTTLLRTLLGLFPPLGGSLCWAPPGRMQVGYVSQHHQVNKALPTTASELVRLGLVGAGLPRKKWQERVTETFEAAGAENLMGRSFYSLSGGERQKVLLARALVRRPRLLMLDEPFGNIDAPTRDALLDLLERYCLEHDAAALFVTHDVLRLQSHPTYLMLIHQGSILAGRRGEFSVPEDYRYYVERFFSAAEGDNVG